MSIFNVYDVCKACKGRLLQNFLRWAAALSLFVWLAPSTFAQTFVTGAITGNTTWRAADGPFVVSVNVNIQNNAVLTVEAGTRIYMAAGTTVTVDAGTINAKGSAVAPIRVQSDKVRTGQLPAPGDWGQWVFNAGSSATALEYVTIEHGKGLSVAASAPTLNHLTINDHQGAAITIDLAASPTGVGNQASGNTINGIAVPAGDIAGSVSWGLRGIPYIVGAGTVNVGAAPVIATVEPKQIQQGDTIVLTVTGTRLAGLSAVTFNTPSVTAQVLSGGSDTQATLSVSAQNSASIAPVNLRALADAGEINLEGAMAVMQAQPAITILSPDTLYVGQGATTLTVNGRNFAGNAVVLIDGSPVATQFVRASQLTASVPEQTVPGNLPVNVRMPNPSQAGQFLLSNSSILQVIASGQLVLSPANLSTLKGFTKTLTLTLPYTAPAGGLVVGLNSSAPQVASVPSTVTVPQGQQIATFVLTALSAGNATMVATMPGFTSGGMAVTVTNAPGYKISPSLIAVPPNGVARVFAIEATEPIAHPITFTVSTTDPSVALVENTSLTFPAGQTRVVATIKGVAAGSTLLQLQDVGNMVPRLENIVYVTPDFASVTAAHAKPVGLVREGGQLSGIPAGSTVGPVVSPVVGLVRQGGPLSGVPAGATVGPVLAPDVGLQKLF